MDAGTLFGVLNMMSSFSIVMVAGEYLNPPLAKLGPN